MGEEVSSQVPSFPRDFLRRFGGGDGGGIGRFGSCGSNASMEETDVGGGVAFKDVELSLGLSLGGCFGAEPKKERLARSSSTAALPAEHELPVVARPLTRTSSLPAEAEEMLRKRKQLQSLKRLETKRKRLERKNSSKPAAKDAKDDILATVTGNGQIKELANGSLPPGLPSWSLRNGRPRAQVVDGYKSSVPAPQTPVASQGSISSGVSDVNNENPTSKQGFVAPELKENRGVNSHSRMSEQSSHSAATKHPAGAPAAAAPGRGEHNGVRKEAAATKNANGFTKSAERSIMESMPCVSTRGDGPNGRRIEGFLYKYRKGEEVRIVCVCHGSSLTPAEFVKHAGGGDVAHPLRHIVVSPSPMVLL